MAFTRERTIRRKVTGEGLGLHTGARVRFALLPAPAGTGVVFVRTDLGGVEIPARIEHTVSAQYATVLSAKTSDGVATVSTVEHLLSAAAGLGVDNLRVELDGGEVPIYDGSAAPFVELLEKAGVAEQSAPRRYLRPTRELAFRVNGSFLTLAPSGNEARLTCKIDFPGTFVGAQEISLTLTPKSYRREVARARTFGFERDLEAMRRNGLIRGATLESAILVGEQGVVNGELRFRDEFVRHKLLDAVGDMALAGAPVLGHLTAVKAGHLAHAMAFRAWLADETAFETVTLDAAPSRREPSGIAGTLRRAAAML